jgi:hypothetical protein
MSYASANTHKIYRICRYLIDIQIYTTSIIRYDLFGEDIDLIEFRDFEMNFIFEPDFYINKHTIYQMNIFFNIIENNKLKCKLSEINNKIYQIQQMRISDIVENIYNDYTDYDQEIELTKLNLFPVEINTLVMNFL